MKRLIALLIILTLFEWSSQGQINLVQGSLVRKTHNDRSSGLPVFEYLDRTNSSDDLQKPTDKDGKIAEINNADMNSIGKLNQIAQQIFSREEIVDLNDKKCTVSCLVLSTGKIVSASILFIGEDPRISMDKLVNFSKRIKEDITFTIHFDRDVKTDGYLSLSFRAFKDLINNPIKTNQK